MPETAPCECALQMLRILCLPCWSQNRAARVLATALAHDLCRQQLQQRLRLLSQENNIHISKH